MSRLQKVVADWDGYQAFAKALCGQGFGLHEVYRQAVAELSGTSPARLDAYWREQSREYVSSLNGTDSNTRTFGAQNSYRSSLLDGLAVDVQKSCELVSALPLEEGLRRMQQRLDAGDAKLIDSLTLRIERGREEEASSAVGESRLRDVKGECAEIFAVVGGEFGGAVSRNTVRFEVESGAAVDVRRQANRDLEERGVLTLDYWFSHRNVKREKWLFHLGKVLPGIAYYRVFKSRTELVHCVGGCLLAAKIFLKTISEPSKPKP